MESFWSAMEEVNEHPHWIVGAPSKACHELPAKEKSRTGSQNTNTSSNSPFQPPHTTNPNETLLPHEPDNPPPKFSTVKSRQNAKRNERKRALRELIKDIRKVMRQIDEPHVTETGEQFTTHTEYDGEHSRTTFQTQVELEPKPYEFTENAQGQVEGASITPSLGSHAEDGSLSDGVRRPGFRYSKLGKRRRERRRKRRMVELINQFCGQENTQDQDNASMSAARPVVRQELLTISGAGARKIERPSRIDKHRKRTAETPYSRRVRRYLAYNRLRKVKSRLVRTVLSEGQDSSRLSGNEMATDEAATRRSLRRIRKVRSERSEAKLREKDMLLPEPAQESPGLNRRQTEMEDSIRHLLGL